MTSEDIKHQLIIIIWLSICSVLLLLHDVWLFPFRGEWIGARLRMQAVFLKYWLITISPKLSLEATGTWGEAAQVRLKVCVLFCWRTFLLCHCVSVIFVLGLFLCVLGYFLLLLLLFFCCCCSSSSSSPPFLSIPENKNKNLVSENQTECSMISVCPSLIYFFSKGELKGLNLNKK